MWQLALFYLILALLTGLLGLPLEGLSRVAALAACGFFLLMAVISFMAWLMPGHPGRPAPH